MESKTRKILYGECRCCLAKGNHRNILKEYINEGVREVYIEIFMDCFNLFLSTNNTLSTLICSRCIDRLRDASAFRTLVADTERHLLNTVNSKVDTVFVNVPVDEPSPGSVVKPEPFSVKLEELSDNEADVIFDSDFISAEDLIDSVPKCDHSSLVAGEAALVARFPRSQLAALPTRTALYARCPQYVTHLDLLKSKQTR